jgi:uncharacterized protein (DUF58 family)
MIYPTARAIALAVLGAPIAVVIGVFSPHLWTLGVAWLLVSFALVLIDARLGADRIALELSVTAPTLLAVGTSTDALVQAAFGRGGAPARVQLALEANDKIAVEPVRRLALVAEGIGRARFALTAGRRGRGMLVQVWARWRGPLGLVWKQQRYRLDRDLPVTLNIRAVKDEAVRLYSRDALSGQRIQQDLGGGSEFHALSDFRAGMNRRTIDWKQSARHGELLAKEFRAERNHHVIMVLDTGRLMCEPLAGLPRIDHALNAALLLTYVSLKSGDRVGLFGFDARPNVTSGAMAGVGAFNEIQRLAALIDYSTEETNYTLALTHLAGRLARRSLLIVFTEFADLTSAELMLENVGRLLEQHLVVFVVMRDEELERLERAAPASADDVSRAVVAAALLREREIVVERLRRLGVLIVEAAADRIGPALVSRYLDLKQRDLL